MEKTVIIKKNDLICLHRVKCQKSDFAALQKNVRCILLNNTSLLDINSVYNRFYRYDGNTCALTNALNNNLPPNEKNNGMFSKTNVKDFIKSANQLFVFEIIVENNSEISNLRFLFLTLHHLQSLNADYYVIISSTKTQHSRYSPISPTNYFRISHLLYFYGKNEKADNICNKIFHRITIFHNNDKGNPTFTKLAVNFKSGFKVGRIVPQIPITKEAYSALTQDYKSNSSEKPINDWIILIEGLCEDYRCKIKNILSDNLCDFDFLNSDCYFEALIFLSMLYFLLDNTNSKIKTLKIKDIVLLHEACINYSQGILQLLENVVVHVIGADNKSGCGILTLRFRNDADAKKIYATDDSFFDNIKYFLEVYLCDYQYTEFQGIVEKFISNVKNRMNNSDFNSDEYLANAKLFCVQRINSKEAQEIISSNSEINEYVDLATKTPSHMVNLKNFFGEGNCSLLNDYLSCANNIAFHYGLQILNSVITTDKGFLAVESGKGNENIFINDHMGMYKYNINDYKGSLFGTQYAIIVPIIIKRDINYLDTVAMCQNNSNAKTSYSFSFLTNANITGNNIETMVDSFFNEINKSFCSIGDDTIAIINILSLENCFSSRTQMFEIIAKSLFLYLTQSGKDKVSNIAIINLNNKHEVIKLFRQFALFFDRTGYSRIIKKNKSVFIIDKNGETDILFYGNDLNSIYHNLSLSQLYGGTDKYAMEILKYLKMKK